MPAMGRRAGAVACVSALVPGPGPPARGPPRRASSGTVRRAAAPLGGRRRGARRGNDRLLVRAQSRDDHAARDGEGRQHAAGDRDRRRQQGDAQRRRQAAHPLHEHLRPGPAASRPRTATTRTTRGSPCRTSTFDRRQREGRATRRRRRRRDLRARRAAQDRQLALLQQRLRRTGPDVGGGAVRALSPVPRPAGVRRDSTFGGARPATCAATAAR